LIAVVNPEMIFQAHWRDNFNFILRIIIHIGKKDRATNLNAIGILVYLNAI